LKDINSKIDNYNIEYFDICNNELLYTNICKQTTNKKCNYLLKILNDNNIHKPKQNTIRDYIKHTRNKLGNLFLKKNNLRKIKNTKQILFNNVTHMISKYNLSIFETTKITKKYISLYIKNNKSIISDMNITSKKITKMLHQQIFTNKKKYIVINNKLSENKLIDMIEVIDDINDSIITKCTNNKSTNMHIINVLNEIYEKNKLLREIQELSKEKNNLITHK
jgi:hypothetical protein